MTLSRRDFGLFGLGAALVAAGFAPTEAIAKIEDSIAKFTGGAEASTGGVSLSTPEIAENGNTVPVGFAVDAPAADVEAIALWADGNPVPDVAVFSFGKLAGAAEASTRIRLATTQNIIAVAKMSDGSLRMAKREVKVTIGGCGG